MNFSGYKVQHQCPQCGAPIILDEDTLFFTCEFCRVTSCIAQNGFARYYFSPSKEISADQELIYLPYWRFKGVQFSCRPGNVAHKFLDISRIAMKNRPQTVPASLGLRSQALTLKLISTKTKGTFLRPWAYKQTLVNMDKRLGSNKTNVFQENIGETSSLIYSPFYTKNDSLFDGILNKPVGPCKRGEINTDAPNICRPEKEIFFISGLCPSCGWDLEGSSDSLAMVCRNCDTLWRTYQNKLAKIRFGCVKPESETDVLLPFWKIKADVSEITLKTYADLIQLANLPKGPADKFKEQNLFFWAPAFKIRPKLFLRLLVQLMILQPDPTFGKHLGKFRLSTANLPSSEAIETIKVSLGALIKPANLDIAALSKMVVNPSAIELIYVPFKSQAHDLYHPKLGVSINKNALKLSSNL